MRNEGSFNENNGRRAGEDRMNEIQKTDSSRKLDKGDDAKEGAQHIV